MLRIGTRGSKLALWQSQWVARQLEALGERCETVIIRTRGDKITDVALAKIGGKGLFTKEIEEALLAGQVDLAVHSLKDLPTELPEGLVLGAVPTREDPRDAIVGARLDDLPAGARVGTSSLRRTAQLRRLRPDLRIEPIRGNLDTRLRKLEAGEFDAIVVAVAGLKRMGWQERIAEIFEPRTLCPAAGQGALAIECRAADGRVRALCERLHDPAAGWATAAERAFLTHVGGGCQVPLGVHASVEETRLRLYAIVLSPEGDQAVTGELEGQAEQAEALGARLAQQLLESGARTILQQVYGAKSESLSDRRDLTGA